MAMTPARDARPRRWSGVLAWAVWALAMLGLAAAAWLDHLVRQAGSPAAAWLLQPAIVPLLVAAVSAATVGALLGSRRPAHPVGWLLLGLGLLVVADVVVSEYVAYGVVARPGSLSGASYLAGVSNGVQFLWLACAGFVLLLTPTGSPRSPPSSSLPRSWRRPGRWWCASAAPAGSSVSSCAGWPWPRPWRPGCCWSRWPPGRWGETAWSWPPSGPAWRCCPWRPARRSCATGCMTWTASSAAR